MAEQHADLHPSNDHATVVAIVLTYESPRSLERCVRSLARQTRPPDRVIIVDNASTDPIGNAALEFQGVEMLRLRENLGPAGGHAAGLQRFLETATEDSYAWVLDDDCVAGEDALRRQLEAAQEAPSPCIVYANTTDADDGSPVAGVGWCGVLIPRVAVAVAGLPMAELFWWVEDTEYLQWRLPRAGFPSRTANGAPVRVHRSRLSRAKPAWKYYYEARNSVYYRLHIQRRDSVPSFATRLTLRARVWRAARSVARLALRAALFEDEQRARKVALIMRGSVDGLRGRLGYRVAVTTPHRPDCPPEPDQSKR